MRQPASGQPGRRQPAGQDFRIDEKETARCSKFSEDENN
jgi:hypothetical protein